MKKELTVLLLLFLILAFGAGGYQIYEIKKIALIARWVMIGIMCFYGILSKKTRKLDFVDFFFGAFMAESFLSVNYSIDPTMTFQKALLLLAVIVVISFEIRRIASFKKGLIGLWNVVVKYSYYTVVFTIVGVFLGKVTYSAGRFTGLFENPNTMGLFAIVAIPVIFANILENKKRRRGKILLLTAALAFLFLSGSRTSFICAFLATLFYIVTVAKNKKPFIFGGIFLFFILFAVSEFMGIEEVPEAFESKFRTKSIIEMGGRMEAWQAALKCTEERPFLGHGYGTEGKIFDYYEIVFKKHYGGHIHNSYLSIIATNGYFGLLLMVPVLGGVALSCMRLFIHRNRLGEIKPIVMAFVGIVMALLVSAVAESWLFAFGSMISMIFWSLSATVLMIANLVKRGKELY